MAEPDVPALLHAAAGGDADSWRALVDLYARRVYALASSRLGRSGAPADGSSRGSHHQGSEIAEEITQSVFVTVASQLSSGAYQEKGRFESWLFRIAMNRIRDEARRRDRQAEPTDPAALNLSASPASSAEPDAMLASALQDAIQHLGDADREIIELRHHAGMSFNAIAELLEEPLGTLLARHHRALRKLKEAIPISLHPAWDGREPIQSQARRSANTGVKT